MKIIFALLSILLATSAHAQTITVGEAKVSVVFYVKEGDNSPYQGLLQLTVPDYTAIKPATIRAQMLAQFEAWKAATAAAKAAPAVEESADDKAARVEALRAEADAIASDPAVAAKLNEVPVEPKAKGK